MPVAVTRHRDRYSAADGKSDKGDPAVRAIALRTDMHAHRPLPADSELAQAITVLARAQQDAVRGMNGRKHPGDPCPCGRGTVYKARSPIHGDFLGCSAFRTHGCRCAWTIDGRRLPKT